MAIFVAFAFLSFGDEYRIIYLFNERFNNAALIITGSDCGIAKVVTNLLITGNRTCVH
jgi:hypothetical protein